MNQDAEVSVNEMIHAAIEAEKRGVDISWKNMVFKIVNHYNNYAVNLENQLEEAKRLLAAQDMAAVESKGNGDSTDSGVLAD